MEAKWNEINRLKSVLHDLTEAHKHSVEHESSNTAEDVAIERAMENLNRKVERAISEERTRTESFTRKQDALRESWSSHDHGDKHRAEQSEQRYREQSAREREQSHQSWQRH